MAVKSHITNETAPGISATIPPGTDNPFFDRKKLLELTQDLIQETHDRVAGERFRVRDGDRERLAYLRLLKEYITLYAALLAQAGAPPTATGLPVVPSADDLAFEAERKKRSREIDEMLMRF